MRRFLFNAFISAKVPIARIAGVKLHKVSNESCEIKVRYGWINRNPFNSMFWAVEGMAAEFSTGTLCISRIKESRENTSLLLVKLEANFLKEAVGTIIFRCDQGNDVDMVLHDVAHSNEARTLRMRSVGIDEQGDPVAEFFFTWSFKARSARKT